MAQAYRYPLTRVCLKGGTMTLPLAMLKLFPEEGQILAVDEATGAEYELELLGPRVLGGLGPFYAAHALEVNDELHVTPLGENRFGFGFVTRAKRAAAAGTAVLAGVLDELASAGVAVTEAEIHALYPNLPAGFDVTPYLAADPRFQFRNGRWQSAAAEEAEPEEAPAQPARIDVFASQPAAELVEAVAAPQVAEQEHAGASAPTAVESAHAHAGAAGMERGHGGAGTRQPPIWSGGEVQDVWQSFLSTAGEPDEGGAWQRVHERRLPEGTRAAPAPSSEDGGADLRVLDLAKRLRGALEPIGFKLEPLGGGQLTLVADMGRRRYEVLAQLLPAGERLDWASLLARRRTSTAKYLAVFGEHHDLLRLTSPAELARATLWGWAALDRLRTLHGTVPLTPTDLESHFERDGLFEGGLERFEQGIAQRVAERGATSEVLTRLGNLRAPSVFLLEELATDAGMSREGVLRILERLSEAPFHLVTKVDQGEFLLRMRVSDALASLASYAVSLRAHLPVRKHELLTGLDDEGPEVPLAAAPGPFEDDGGEEAG